MQKIKNVVVSKSEFSENVKWAEVESLKFRLLESSDWILLPDSNVTNINAWKEWRMKLKNIKRQNFKTPEEMHLVLQDLENKTPRKIYKRFNYNHIELTKEKLIKMIRFFYNKKIDVDLYHNFSHPSLIDERYKEAVDFKNGVNNQILLTFLAKLSGKELNDVVDEAILEKEQYFLLLLRMQKELEKEIKAVVQEDNIENLEIIYNKYSTWISTLTSAPTAF